MNKVLCDVLCCVCVVSAFVRSCPFAKDIRETSSEVVRMSRNVDVGLSLALFISNPRLASTMS
jgi:hypothetical protein